MYRNVPECTGMYLDVPECTSVTTEEVASASEGGSNRDWRGFLVCTHQQLSSG